ncbi:MAG: HAMP domain-containing sensor histidine kinase [Bacteroidota bacterium]|nr:HAMP domain-containing sensor histidine kinase [Bacteroidota bacterium]
MKKKWNFISNLGTADPRKQLNDRTIILTNQLNFVTFFIMLLVFLSTVLVLGVIHKDMSYGTLRVVNLLIISFLNLLLARLGYTRLSRLSLIFLPPIVFLLGPTLIGYVEEESYTYYPYVLIAASVIPQLLVNPLKEKPLYFISLLYYLLLVVFIDRAMVSFGSTLFPIVDRINTFYAFYKISQVTIFLFISAGIYYLRVLNLHYEDELSRKNNELDQQNKELKEQKIKIQQQKDELVSKEISTWQKLVRIISHEIMNSAIPITNLVGITGQMLEDESGMIMRPEKLPPETTEDIHHGLKIIESRTQALINMVKATQSLTHIPEPNIRSINIMELFDRIKILYKGRFKEKGILFGTLIVPENLKINADLELIEQVIINLIQNSIEAMLDTMDPIISITAEMENSGQVQISVTDNGPGISEEKAGRIFLPFYSTKPDKSGIGLSLSQQIMLLHNGRLEFSSTPGKGATFRLVF